MNVVAFLLTFVLGKDAPGGYSRSNELLGLHFFMASDFQVFQLITYMFMHGGFEHIIFNMFALWMFGCVVERVWGAKKFLFLLHRMWCRSRTFPGVGSVRTVLSDGFRSDSSFWHWGHLDGGRNSSAVLNAWTTVGASGAIYGILLAFGMIFPEERIFIFPLPVPIKAKYFVIGYAAIELFSAMMTSGDGVAHVAHLGGMVFGFF